MSDFDFASLSLPDAQLKNLSDLGYAAMTPIQAASLPHALAGKDLIAKAKTGSGKTASFGIGLIEKLNPRFFGVQGLVLCPTRELATQVAKELRRLARYRDNIKILMIAGGQPIGPQIGSLEHGAHIVVGTPGRIADHLRKGTLQLDQLNTLVLDEADRMLDMGFIDAIAGIIEHTPASRQTLLFSATYPDEIAAISARFQREPITVSVEAQHSETQIEQRFYRCDRAGKSRALIHWLERHRPESTLVFCNTKQGCDDLRYELEQAGLVALALHGDMEQRERDEMLVRFANRSASVLIATDVAARGLDISDLPAVVNYDLPRQADTYVHRIGRTGRAGQQGLALSLFSESEQYKIDLISDYQGRPIEPKDPDLRPLDPQEAFLPPMVTLMISGGRKDKVRPGDLLGALTGDAEIPGSAVGKIDIADYSAFVAIERSVAKKALGRLINGKIKGRRFKVRML
ncbi:ATP-dependent RNA helicase DbpA [Motiliproteus sediminis]|uniref:ATP-dependent RNA helicase DbpA n=1 Tax=Motiliproteus sediminis TaxID=1468178 RepID=UPI001AEF3CF4|nr:ATP-dependent RNA helicase DbpA [Motiliproteus sediminis]